MQTDVVADPGVYLCYKPFVPSIYKYYSPFKPRKINVLMFEQGKQGECGEFTVDFKCCRQDVFSRNEENILEKI